MKAQEVTDGVLGWDLPKVLKELRKTNNNPLRERYFSLKAHQSQVQYPVV